MSWPAQEYNEDVLQRCRKRQSFPDDINAVRIKPGNAGASISWQEVMEHPSEEQAPPFRLLDLAPERRNPIYGFVFAVEPGQEVNLFAPKAQAPSCALTATWTKIRGESLGIYHDSLRQFWTESDFYIRIHPDHIYERAAYNELRRKCKVFPSCGVRTLRFVAGDFQPGSEHWRYVIQVKLSNERGGGAGVEWDELYDDDTETAGGNDRLNCFMAQIAASNFEYHYEKFSGSMDSSVVSSCLKGFRKWIDTTGTDHDLRTLWDVD